MERILMILEVSGKQDYIFSGKKLKGNTDRSDEIAWVTGGFLREAGGDLFDEGENLVYAGGGHAVLQFPGTEAATAFARRLSEAVLRRYPGMELFLTQYRYAEEKAPGENLLALIQALERKKSLRRGSFHRRSWGVETLDKVTFRPAPVGAADEKHAPQPVAPPEGWIFPESFEDLTGKDGFIAVVHIDGNAMGARVSDFYAAHAGETWEDFRIRARRFSEGIQADFTAAFREMAEELAARKEDWEEALGLDPGLLPLRPVILAGDDVCFVSAGSLGLECARLFLEKLGLRKNGEDGKGYAACAGVAMVHRKYPFHTAYGLAEELCSNAKRFGAELDPEGRVSAMDWHVEFGQLKDSLEDIREDYITEDGGQLELRPVVFSVPEGIDARALGGVRTWAFFRSLCAALQGERGRVARSKLKELRTALKQGELESRFFLEDKEITDLLYHALEAEWGDKVLEKAFEDMIKERKLKKEAFKPVDGVKRCLYFDAIELIDHCVFLKEAEK